jgi:hypothetical protein
LETYHSAGLELVMVDLKVSREENLQDKKEGVDAKGKKGF